MNINFKQTQFELFPASAGPDTHRAYKPRYLFSNLTLSLENLVIVGIFVLMGGVVSFSLGVEKGKRLSRLNVETQGSHAVAAAVLETGLNSRDAAKTTNGLSSSSLKSGVKTQETPKKTTTKIINPAPTPPSRTQEPADASPEILNEGYTIQVASFKSLKYAQQEAADLKKRGYDIIVLPKKGYSIVCVGKFSHKDEAKVLISRLKKTYKDCLIRRL